jgi:hypothetical protein
MPKHNSGEYSGVSLADIDKALQELQLLAAAVDSASPQYRAIELGAKALHFVASSETRRHFERFVLMFNTELTEDQLRKLQKLGIDP